MAAEVVVNKMQDMPQEMRKTYTQQISHISTDLKEVMERREQGLDEDWSEDALSAEEEVKEERDLLLEIDAAVRSITGAKGSHAEDIARVADTAGLSESALPPAPILPPTSFAACRPPALLPSPFLSKL